MSGLQQKKHSGKHSVFYALITKECKDTRFYKEIIKECGYFRRFIDKKQVTAKQVFSSQNMREIKTLKKVYQTITLEEIFPF